MVNSYTKGTNVPLSTHFSLSEFDCKCASPVCTVTLVDDFLLESLEVLHEWSGPLKIMSGFRCKGHNAEVGGVPNSQHTKGTAADVRPLNGSSPNLVAQYAERIVGFRSGGIGIYRDLNFTHLDVRTTGPARWAHPIKC